MGKFARTSTTNPLFAMGKKGLALVFALALACAVALPACSASDAGSGSGGSASEQQAAIDVTVKVASTVEDVDFEAQELAVSVPEGATVYDALVESGLDVVAADSDYGMFVSGIAGLEGGDTSGWIYTVNGEEVMDACDDLVLSAGDVVEWSYIAW